MVRRRWQEAWTGRNKVLGACLPPPAGTDAPSAPWLSLVAGHCWSPPLRSCPAVRPETATVQLLRIYIVPFRRKILQPSIDGTADWPSDCDDHVVSVILVALRDAATAIRVSL